MANKRLLNINLIYTLCNTQTLYECQFCNAQASIFLVFSLVCLDADFLDDAVYRFSR